MKKGVAQELFDLLIQMPPEGRRAFLRSILQVRPFCSRCPVKNRAPHRNPCYACIIMPDGRGRPVTSVN